MRITNKIMQNNSLYNINSNKVSENDISTSIMTGKKVNRPSDDPVVAIRSLRLRANVTELNQYYEKNTEDAAAWLKVTEGALTSISGQDSILVDLQKLLVAGPDKYKTLSDWDAIVTQIEQLSDEYYSVGNVDYAGRYAFTGYRTDTSLSFLEDTSKEYTDIQDEFNAKNIDTSDRVTSCGDFANGHEIDDPRLESNISLYTVGRLRLSYDNLDGGKLSADDIANAQTNLTAAQGEVDSKKDALKTAREELEAAKAELVEQKKPLHQARQELAAAQHKAASAANDLASAEETLKKAEETLTEAEKEFLKAVDNRNDAQDTIDNNYPDYNTKTEAISKLEEDIAKLGADIGALDPNDADYETKKAALESQLDQKYEEYNAAKKDLRDWTNADPYRKAAVKKLTDAKAEYAKTYDSLSKANEEKIEAEEAKTKAEQKKAEADAEVVAAQTKVNDEETRVEPYQQEVDQKQIAVNNAVAELATAQEALDKINGKLEAVVLRYREEMAVSASSTVLPASHDTQMINLSFQTGDGASHTVHLPVKNDDMKTDATIEIENPDGTKETYTAYKNGDGYRVEYTADKAGAPGSGSYTGIIYVNAKGVIYDGADPNEPVTFPAGDNAILGGNTPANYGDILSATTTVTQAKMTEVKMTVEKHTLNPEVETIRIPLADETKQPYTMTVQSVDGKDYIVTVNTDGTYTLEGKCKNTDGEDAKSIVQLNSGGAVHSSYVETEIKPSQVLDATSDSTEIDEAYGKLQKTYDEKTEKWNGTTGDGSGTYILNAATGEILLSKGLNDKLTSLKDLINANTLDAVYDKTNYKKGDTRPENLFACTYDGVKYNIGTAGHTMEYDVGFNQKIEVNTMACDVFTNDVKREAQDLRNILDKMKDVDNKINILQAEYNNSTSPTDKEQIQKEIYAAKKAYDYLTDVMKDEFGAKITGVTKAINMANNAVTINGTRSKRLDLIQSRLMDQVATFQELQSENEDVDLAEAGTMLAMARLTYEASLQATGKIMTTSLMDYI